GRHLVTGVVYSTNVMIANGSESKWSVKLDDEEQLSAIAQTLGCDLL
ncbi:TPA: DUF3389 family protein, partial [Vibrio cholerae]